MSYIYNPLNKPSPNRDAFTHVDDEECITAYGTGTAPNYTAIPVYTYPVVYIADECIAKIADAVAKRIN